MKFAGSLFGALDWLVRVLTIAAVAVASIFIMFVAVLNTIDVASASLFNSPIPVVSEICSVALAVVIFAGMAHAQSRQQNVRVDLIVSLLPASVRRVLHGATLLIAAAMFIFLALRSTELATKSWNSAETAMALIPFQVYPFKIGVAIGAWIGAAEFVRQFVWLALGAAVESETKAAGGAQPSERL